MVNYADEIKRAVPARELFEHYGFEINRAGFCHSPFAANDKTPSLKVYDGDRGWHDFSSGKGGDIIAFVQEYFNLSFMDACKKINADFDLHLPLGEKLTLAQQREADRKAAQRKREQIEREMAQKRVLTAYHAAYDRWVSLDIMKRENAPQSPSEPFNERYAYAVKRIDEAGYELDKATDALRRFESQS
jgi:DNA primase